MADGPHAFPPHGAPAYLQLPAVDVAASLDFYRGVFGWSGDTEFAAFEAPGLIGQWVTDRPATPGAGPVLWLSVDDIATSLAAVAGHGGAVLGPPQLDQGVRWLAEVADPAGNRIGLVAMVRPVQPQTLIAVRDVEASSRWYRELLGFESDHGGPNYERLARNGTLVMQLHSWEAEHDATHGRIGDPDAPVGNGVLLWFGEVADFDAAVERARSLDAEVVLAPHRNPPSGQGNGPAHRELWIRDLDGYTVVIASPDGEAYEL